MADAPPTPIGELKVRGQSTLSMSGAKDKDDDFDANSRNFLRAFNKLQLFSARFNVKLPFPEVVVVGNQSSGKSSAIEAFVGFKFNFVENKIATRRPLILQCEQDRKYESEPYWELNGTVLSSAAEVSDHLKRLNMAVGDTISADPVALKVRYAHCANITVVDLPGFRIIGDPGIKAAIENLVRRETESPLRYIVCFENATNDFTACSSLHFIQQNIDPRLERTLLVFNKFDLQLPQLEKKPQMAADYFGSESHSLPGYVPRFYTALPTDDSYKTNDEYRMLVAKLHNDHRSLLGGLEPKIDDKYVKMVGFDCFRRRLEQLMQKEYRKQAPKVLEALQREQRKIRAELEDVKQQLLYTNVDNLRQSMEKSCSLFCQSLQNVLEGVADPEIIARHGQRLNEELEGFALAGATGHRFSYDALVSEECNISEFLPEAQFRLHGGAQYKRLLREFELSIRSKEFPEIIEEQIWQSHGLNPVDARSISWEAVVSKLVQNMSSNVFKMDVDLVCKRAAYILGRMFDIAIELISSEDIQAFIGMHPGFKEFLNQKYTEYVEQLAKELKQRIEDYIDSCTQSIHWKKTAVNADAPTDIESVLAPSPRQTLDRLQTEMSPKSSSDNESWFEKFPRCEPVTPHIHKLVQVNCHIHFGAIRSHIADFVNLIFDVFLRLPLFRKLAPYLAGRACSEDEEARLVSEAAVEHRSLEERRELLEKRLEESDKELETFSDLMRGMK